MKIRCLFFVLLLSVGMGCAEVFGQITNRVPEAMMTIRVIDEDGGTLSGMPVHVWLDRSMVLDGVTDTNGLYIAHGKCSTLDPPIRVEKEGHYTSSTRFRFTNIGDNTEYQWQPWNPVVTIQVRRMVNPIPMYAKHVQTEIPVLDQPVGFDLVHGDWIAPYGRGEVADFAFMIRKRYVDFRNFDSSFDLILTNAFDGLQETSLKVFGVSEFRLLRNAPIDGYTTRAFHLTDSSTHYFKPDSDQSFYFRVRSVTNELGQITSASYGKIRGYIGFDVTRAKRGKMHFTYYLNPTPNDRNLEFDPKQNLFKHLKPTERVTAP